MVMDRERKTVTAILFMVISIQIKGWVCCRSAVFDKGGDNLYNSLTKRKKEGIVLRCFQQIRLYRDDWQKGTFTVGICNYCMGLISKIFY